MEKGGCKELLKERQGMNAPLYLAEGQRPAPTQYRTRRAPGGEDGHGAAEPNGVIQTGSHSNL
jgi:hypothetical protein